MDGILRVRRNPYFIGINSAIKVSPEYTFEEGCRNPYFIGINSAILIRNSQPFVTSSSQSLFYWN